MSKGQRNRYLNEAGSMTLLPSDLLAVLLFLYSIRSYLHDSMADQDAIDIVTDAMWKISREGIK